LEKVKTDMDTNTITTKFMDMLNKRDNGLIETILRHLDELENGDAEDLNTETLRDMFKAANGEYFANLNVAAKKTKKKRGTSAWTIFGAILRETVTAAVKEGDRGEGTPFVVAAKCLGKMWKSGEYTQKDELVTKVGELNKNLLEDNKVLSEDEAKQLVKTLFPKKTSLTCKPDDIFEDINIKFDKALQEKAVTVFMEKFGRIPIDEPPKPKKKSKGKKKGAKDPNKPKKAKSSYIFFCSVMRATVKDDMDDDAKAVDVTRELGRRWRELSDEDKKPYQEMAEADKQRYADEMESYSGSSGGSGDEVVEMEVDSEREEVPKTPKKKKKKPVEAPGAPKKKKKSKLKKSKSPIKKKKKKEVAEEDLLENLLSGSDSDED
jgi:hypothetical protein